MDVQEYIGGFSFSYEESSFDDFSRSYASYPDGVQYSADEILFYGDDMGMNEFGFVYIVMFILGNLTRYYPEKWIEEVEASTDMIVLVDNFLHQSAYRAPLLLLSELQDALILGKSLRI